MMAETFIQHTLLLQQSEFILLVIDEAFFLHLAQFGR